MDIQRVLILLGLAVTSYMLILAWNDDYGQTASSPVPTTTVVTQQQDGAAIPGDLDALGLVDAGTQAIVDDDVPRLDAEESTIPTIPAVTRRRITVETDVLHVQIDPLGGDMVQVALPGFPATLDTPDVPYLLVDPRNSYVAQSGLIGPNGTDKQGTRPVFTSARSDYTLGDDDELTVTLSYIQEDGTEIIKDFVFRRGDYLVDVNYTVKNAGYENWRGGMFAQIKRDGQDPLTESENLMGMQPYVGGATRSDEEFYAKLEFDDLEEESYKLTRNEGYMAMVQHYFVTAWIPGQQEGNTFRARKLKDKDAYVFGFTTAAIEVAPAASGTISSQFYVGPKDQYRLRDIATGLELTVDYGFLWWLAQPLFYLLTLIHSYVGNWGLAIIGLTMIVKSLLYPLSATSFKSMAKMRKLQPEMAKLKERHGEDRQQFSQAMMDLYKKEGANPLGGCFPILLQMPVFLALYWTLMESVELRQAPFFLWIHDLSAMDPYFVLPILMGISMYLTQMLQPEPPDPIQAKVFKMMPIMFTFFFLWFPSGLVLYWLVNNILSILQQWYVTRQIEKAS
jgi:YidC/Oxa1 family membrane protein insertase